MQVGLKQRGIHLSVRRERPVFGMVRYMNNKALEKKFDMTRYVQKTIEAKERVDKSGFVF